MAFSHLSRRRFLKLSAVGGVGLALAACAAPAAPGGSEQAESAAAPAQETTTIRFMSRAGARYLPTYEEVLATDFREQNPNIEVQIEPAPDGWQDKLLAQMVAGTAVDIFQAWGNIFFNWTERDLILDVQPYVDLTMTDEEVADYNEFQWEGLVMRGIRVGMPKYINLMTVTINKDLFDRYDVEYPPEDGEWDHDDYYDMARRLTEAARKEGEENRWGGWIPAWAWDRFWYRVDMFGGRVVDEKYGTKCMLDTPESQAALQWIWDGMWKDNYFAQPAQVENQWFRAAMTPGFVCMAESGTYPISTEDELRPAFRWDMRHVPKGPTGIRKVLGTTDAWSITKQTKHPDEAWAVLKFLSGPIFQRKAIVGAEGIIPVLKSLISTFIDDVRALRPELEDVRLETIQEILDWGYAEDTFWFKNQNAAYEIINPALEKVYIVGDVGPEYFIEICQQVNESQMES
ncbi:extracellular solute-binding protein [Litorilinea aerophila]|nr:extracellular solute-binding protein [Litorilinea aerophila]MCC9075224.1 extracellular solute-binding protein [Litorilinea aerophila]